MMQLLVPRAAPGSRVRSQPQYGMSQSSNSANSMTSKFTEFITKPEMPTPSFLGMSGSDDMRRTAVALVWLAGAPKVFMMLMALGCMRNSQAPVMGLLAASVVAAFFLRI